MPDTRSVPLPELKALIGAAAARQFPPSSSRSSLVSRRHQREIGAVAECVLFAQRRSSNQGASKLINPPPLDPQEQADNSNDERRGELDHPIVVSGGLDSGKGVAMLDGRGLHAMLVLRDACDLAADLSKGPKNANLGIACVGTRNTDTSSGCLGFYADRLAKKGLVSIVMATSPPLVAPVGSSEGVFGTNPICFGFPAPVGSDEGPLVIDLSTSSMAFYGLVEAAVAGAKLPAGIGFDSAGGETTEPNDVLKGGALRAFGGAKGSALALAVQVLAGALVGANTAVTGAEGDWGHLVCVLDPAAFESSDSQGSGSFAERLRVLADRVRGARPLAGSESVRLPGERSGQIDRQVEETQSVVMEVGLYCALRVVAGQDTAAAGSPKAKL
jgi:LDH2 family malate/lactate/ureidoglycolate dehydrogenase